MNVRIRPLRPEDIGRVSEIERQAFPTLWPPTPFRRELDSPQSTYLVAWAPNLGEPASTAFSGKDEVARAPRRSLPERLIKRLIDNIKGRLPSGQNTATPGYSLLGFIGLWFTYDEAHITGIAVDLESQRKGIGELLLMAAIELAIIRHADVVTLEARVSNNIAQSLYEKHGFQKVGIRKAYYTDNREDAAIMTTQPINSDTYQRRFQERRDAYRQRHGEILMELA